MSRIGPTVTAAGGARAADADTSPEFEFTFLRPTHQPRTLARPASSYLARPTSPTPPSRPTSPSPVPPIVPSISQQRPLGPKTLRQGAPRLGGLGLGGIAPPEPAPYPRASSQPRTDAPKLRQPAPAIMAVPPQLPERRTPSPASFAPSPANLPVRPFLSPEMDKPTVRAGTFALDTHTVPDPVGDGKKSRSGSPEGDKGGIVPDAAATTAPGADAPAAAVDEELEEEQESESREPDWMQTSADVDGDGRLAGFSLAPANGATGHDDRSYGEGAPPWASKHVAVDEGAVPPAGAHGSSANGIASEPSDVEDVSFDDGHSIVERSLAGITHLPFAVVDKAAEAPVERQPTPAVEHALCPVDGVNGIVFKSSDVEDNSFDNAHSVVERSLAVTPRFPLAVVDKAAEVPIERQPTPVVEHALSSVDGADARLVESEEGTVLEPEEDIVLDGPSNASPTSSVAPSFDESTALHESASFDESPADPLHDDFTGDTLREEPLAPSQDEPVPTAPSVPPAVHIAAALLARAERSTSSAGSLDHADDVDSAPSPAELSRSASFAGSLASEYSTHDTPDPSSLPPLMYEPYGDDPAPLHAAEPAFTPADAVEEVHEEPACEEDRRDAAASYPSPPSSPGSPVQSDLPTEPPSPPPQVSSLPMVVPPSTPQQHATFATPAEPNSRRSSLSSPSSPPRASGFTTSPSTNSYEGLGLRLPSSLGRNKRSSFILPASPPMSPEVVEQSLPTIAVPSATLMASVPRDAPVEESEEEVAAVADEPVDKVDQPAPTAPLATPLIAHDYALPLDLDPVSVEEDAPAVFSSADVRAAPVWEEGNDEFTPASSASNSPALSAHTAASDFDEDVPEEPLDAPVASTDDEPSDSTASTAAPDEGGPGVVDVGVAVAGALVMGGLAVGQSAWRGLSGWAWRSEAPVPTPAAPAARAKTPEAVPAETLKRQVPEEEPREEEEAKTVTSSERAGSSVVATQWGEVEFDAPDGFLDEFKRAMEEIGIAQLEADDQAAQEAAYLAASRQHDEAIEGEPQPEPSSSESTPAPSVRTLVFPSSGMRRSRPPSISDGSVRSNRGGNRPLTPADELLEGSDGDMDELDRMLAPVWDPRAREQDRPAPPSKHGYAAPPGLAGSVPLSRTLSPTLSTLSRSSPSLNSSLSSRVPPVTKEQPSTSRSSRSIFKFGSSKSSKAPKSKKGDAPAPATLAPSSPTLSSPRSAMSLTSIEEDTTSALSKGTSTSRKPASRRRSFLSFGGNSGPAPPIPSIESRIADTTYVHYGSKTPKPKRRVSDASTVSLAADMYASRDPVLIPGVPSSPSLYTALLSSPATAGMATGSSASCPLRSSLRGGAEGKQVESKLYRVRFANASRGLGLRSVAEDEAERGGDDVALKWIGVGRGRYGNLTIADGEEVDLLYESQVKKIKGKWRAFGSDQSRDWAGVRID